MPKVGSIAFCSCASLVQLCVHIVWAKIWVSVTQTLLQVHPHFRFVHSGFAYLCKNYCGQPCILQCRSFMYVVLHLYVPGVTHKRMHLSAGHSHVSSWALFSAIWNVIWLYFSQFSKLMSSCFNHTYLEQVIYVLSTCLQITRKSYVSVTVSGSMG